MNELTVLITFAVGLTGALLFGYIAIRLKVSPIIGYLLAGIAVGPFTPGVVADHAVAETIRGDWRDSAAIWDRLTLSPA